MGVAQSSSCYTQDAATLPYLQLLLVAFFNDALITWEHFTVEFAPGDLIDFANVAERDQAWMPTTNDANEGELGSYYLFIYKRPNSSLHL